MSTSVACTCLTECKWTPIGQTYGSHPREHRCDANDTSLEKNPKITDTVVNSSNHSEKISMTQSRNAAAQGRICTDANAIDLRLTAHFGVHHVEAEYGDAVRVPLISKHGVEPANRSSSCTAEQTQKCRSGTYSN